MGRSEGDVRWFRIASISRVGMEADLGAARFGQTALYSEGPGFDSQPLHLPLSALGCAEQDRPRPALNIVACGLPYFVRLIVSQAHDESRFAFLGIRFWGPSPGFFLF